VNDDDLIVHEGTANEKYEADQLQYFEFLLASGELEYPDEDSAGCVNRGALSRRGILGDCDTECIEGGDRETNEDGEENNHPVGPEVLEGASRVLQLSIVAELFTVAVNLLEDHEHDDGDEESPEALESHYLQGVEIVVAQEFLLDDVEATRE